MSSDLTAIPRPPWPANHRAALCLFVEIDAIDLDSSGTAQSSIASGLDYTADGMGRLLTLFDDLDVLATTAFTARALATYPVLVRQAAERGHEVVVAWTGAKSDAGKLDDQIVRAAHLAGTPVAGVTHLAPDVATESWDSGERELDWVATLSNSDLPRSQSTHVAIPTSPFWNDLTWLGIANPQPPSALLEVWSTGLAAVRAEGGLMTLVVHPHVIGRPGFAAALSRILDEAIAAGDVWITRADHLAIWWKENQF